MLGWFLGTGLRRPEADMLSRRTLIDFFWCEGDVFGRALLEALPVHETTRRLGDSDPVDGPGVVDKARLIDVPWIGKALFPRRGSVLLRDKDELPPCRDLTKFSGIHVYTMRLLLSQHTGRFEP